MNNKCRKFKSVNPSQIFPISRIAEAVGQTLRILHSTCRSMANLGAAVLVAMSVRGLAGSHAQRLLHRTSTAKWCEIQPSKIRSRSVVILVGVLMVLSIVLPTADASFPAEISVSDLDGSNGFTIAPSHADRSDFGGTVAAAGDVNADGIPDLIIGDPFAARPPGRFARGQAYVIFGRASGFPGTFDPSNLDGHNGFTVTGTQQLGEVVSSAGDINGDGIADVLISERFSSVGGRNRGRVFVIFGRNTEDGSQFPSNIDVPVDLDGTNGFELRGAEAYDLAGSWVSSAGDLNADGVADLIIGASHNFFSPIATPGRAYVVFGRNTKILGPFPLVLDLGALNGHDGFTLNGVESGEGTGAKVSDLGDINGDSIDDIIVGTSHQPRTYVVFGRSVADQGMFPAQLELASLDGTNGFVLTGSHAESLAWLGDPNNDGINDMILGKSANNSGANGKAFIIFGRDTESTGQYPAEVDVTALDGKDGFVISGIWTTGQYVAGVGDVNADGVHDIGVKSLPFGEDNTYVVYGRDSQTADYFPAVIDLQTLNGDIGFVIRGTTVANSAGLHGNQLSRAGDVNGDSIDDLLIGDAESPPSGKAYVVFGRKAFASLQSLNDINGDGSQDIAALIQDPAAGTVKAYVKDAENGASINTVAFDGAFTPTHFSSLPDINGNGAPELVVVGKNPSTGTVHAEIRDSLSGQRLNTITYDPDFIPKQLAIVSDLNGNGADELALLVKAIGTGKLKVSLKDSMTDAWLGTIRFDASFEPKDMVVLPDRSGNGWPELAVLAVRDSTTKADKVEIRDLLSGTLISNTWINKKFDPKQMTLLTDINGDGFPELGILMTGSVRVEVRDGRTGNIIKNVWYNEDYTPIDMVAVPDVDGSGADELAVLVRFESKNRLRATLKDSQTADFVSHVGFNGEFTVHDLAVIDDINGNSVSELLILGTRSGTLRAVIKDAETKESIGSIMIP